MPLPTIIFLIAVAVGVFVPAAIGAYAGLVLVCIVGAMTFRIPGASRWAWSIGAAAGVAFVLRVALASMGGVPPSGAAGGAGSAGGAGQPPAPGSAGLFESPKPPSEGSPWTRSPDPGLSASASSASPVPSQGTGFGSATTGSLALASPPEPPGASPGVAGGSGASGASGASPWRWALAAVFGLVAGALLLLALRFLRRDGSSRPSGSPP